MKADIIPDFLLFSQLSLNQQKVPSSNQVGEQEIVSTHTEKKKKKWFSFLFWLEAKFIKKYHAVDLQTSDLKRITYSCQRHI